VILVTGSSDSIFPYAFEIQCKKLVNLVWQKWDCLILENRNPYLPYVKRVQLAIIIVFSLG